MGTHMELHCDEKRAGINQSKTKATATSSSNLPASTDTADLTIYLNLLSSTGSAMWSNAVEHHYIAKIGIHESSPENGYENSLGPGPKVRAPIPVSTELQAHGKCERLTSVEIDGYNYSWEE